MLALLIGFFLARLFVFVQNLEGIFDVLEENAGHVATKMLADDNAHDGDFLGIWREGVGRNHPSSLTQFCREIENGKIFDLVFKANRDDGKQLALVDHVHRWQFREVFGQELSIS